MDRFAAKTQEGRTFDEAKGREALKTRVNWILETWPTYPANLGSICSFLDVQVAYSEKVPRFGAYLSFLETNWDRAVILLPEDGQGTAYERFCIAHELAHLFLARDLGTHCDKQSDYWKIEELCDEFARNLLAPEYIVEDHIFELGPRELLRATFTLHSDARIPWSQAAARVANLYTSSSFFRIASQQDGRMKIVSSTLPRQRERGRLLDTNAGFMRFLSLATSRTKTSIYLDRPALQRAPIPTFANAIEGSALMRRGYGSVSYFVALLH